MTPTKRTDSFIRKGVIVTVELDYLTDGKEYYFDEKMGRANMAKIKQAFLDAGLKEEYLRVGHATNFTKLTNNKHDPN